MNKKEFIKKLAGNLEATQKDTEAMVDAFIDTLKECVIEEGKVDFYGFACFEKKTVPAKSGVTKLGGVEKAWTTEAHDEIKVSLKKSYKAI